MNLGTLGGIFAIDLYLQQDRGLSSLAAGLNLVPLALPLAALTPFTGRLVGVVGARLPASLGLLASGAGYLGTALLADGINNPVGWAFLALAGTGMGGAVPALVAGATEARPRPRRHRRRRQQQRPPGRRRDRSRPDRRHWGGFAPPCRKRRRADPRRDHGAGTNAPSMSSSKLTAGQAAPGLHSRYDNLHDARSGPGLRRTWVADIGRECRFVAIPALPSPLPL
jgi:hypothetical protein